MKIISLLFFNLLLISCKPNATLPTNNQNLKRVWMLTRFKDFDKARLIQYQASIDLTTVHKASATLGCNNVFFTYKIKENNKIVFTNIEKTEKYCNEKMDIENAFVTEIQTYKNYQIKGHKLLLTNGKNEQLECVAQDWD